MPSGMWLYFAFLFVLVAAFAGLALLATRAYSVRNTRSQVSSLQQYVTSQGWTYQPTDPSLLNRWSGPPFGASGARIREVISGKINGHWFLTFEYNWDEGSDQNKVTVRRTVSTVALPATFPMLRVIPQTRFDQVARRLGSQDVDFEAGVFNDTFAVKADDERYAHALIHPRAMELLLSSPIRNQEIRIDGNTVLTWYDGPFNINSAALGAEVATRFTSLIPPFAIAEFPTTAPTGFAGSVTGVREELTGESVKTTASILALGASLLVTAGFIWWITNYLGGINQPHASSSQNSTILGFIVVVVVGIMVSAIVVFIKKLVAIRLNKRDRDRRLS